MTLAQQITKFIDRFYVRPIESICSRSFFRYAVCGATNMLLDAVWYFLIYHFIVREQFINLGFAVISPHISSLVIVFPITFFTGFLLNRYIAFNAAHQPSRQQLWRYALSVFGSIVINYLCMKLFVECFNFWPTPSKLLTTIVSVVYSFLAAKYFTFRSSKH